MKVLVKNDDQEIITKLLVGDQEMDFDYIELIDNLYKNNQVEIDIDPSIEDELQNEIKLMYKEITDIFQKKEINE